MKKPLILMILDGFGINSNQEGNAISVAHTPNLDKLFTSNPFTTLGASGMDVGLPEGQMGNSEVGHTNMGAGRVVYQELTKITKEINSGEFFENSELNAAIDNAINNHTSLHVIGLLSNGGVHSHNSHLYAILKLAKEKGLSRVFIHAILDGRDTAPNSGKNFISECEEKIKEIGTGKISTIIGRYFAMDRDNRWDRVKKAYDAMFYNIGIESTNALEAIEKSYKNNITDEFVEPTVISGCEKIRENDSIIFFNFRPDRAREITRSIVEPEFDKFPREKFIKTKFVCMTQYDKTIPNVTVAFKPQSLKNTLGEYISKKGLKQLRIAETEKYAHVTFFFNGGVEKPYPGEERELIPSPKVATYDLKPEMSAYKVTEKVIEYLNKGNLDVIILNFANCDMVGHTGIFNAAVKAIETVDECVGKIISVVNNMNGITLITADHGNADKMYDQDDKPFTAHTTNRVPFCVVGYDCILRENAKLSDISPTILDILKLEKPIEMDGTTIITH